MSVAAPTGMLPTTGQAPDPDAGSAWLAAYALGLIYSSRSDQQRLACLREAAHPHPGRLGAAHLRLQAADLAEPTSRQQALRLLEHAMAPTEPAT
jgi:hypothetical protein